MDESKIINRAIMIEPGKTYVIECPGRLSECGQESLRRRLEPLVQEGSRFILLEDGMKIATEQVVVEEVTA